MTAAASRVEVRRGDVTLSCLEAGAGDTVVLLHGLAGGAREMWATAEALLPDHHVIAVDQRGHGRSTRRPADLSRRAFADDVAAVIAERAGGGPVTLVGQSMGGHTALLVAAWHPRLVRQLVLVEAGIGGGDPGVADSLGTWFAGWPVPFATTGDAAAFLGANPIAGAWIADLEERPDGWWPRFDADVMRDCIAAVGASACWDEWAGIRARTLLVRGATGMIAEAEAVRMRESRPGVEQVVVPDAGHDLHLEQPAAWARILRDFLRR